MVSLALWVSQLSLNPVFFLSLLHLQDCSRCATWGGGRRAAKNETLNDAAALAKGTFMRVEFIDMEFLARTAMRTPTGRVVFASWPRRPQSGSLLYCAVTHLVWVEAPETRVIVKFSVIGRICTVKHTLFEQSSYSLFVQLLHWSV